MKKQIILLALGLAVFVGTRAFPIPSLRTSFVAHYPYTRKTQLNSCTTCHMPSVKDFLNSYGLAYRDAKMDFEKIESMDSDGDGVSNIDEIKSLSFPGSFALHSEYFVFSNFMGDVHFNHEAHVAESAFLSNGNCSNCHGGAMSFPKLFNDNVSAETLAHKICWDCHQASESANAPSACSNCHQSSR